MTMGFFTNPASAMKGMSFDLNTIGQNISNMNTTGYKTAETDFHTQLSQVIGEPASSLNSGTPTSIFGVGWSTRTEITNQGSIVGTSEWTNVAINGNGFFMVAPPTAGGPPATPDVTSNTSVMYTRAGDFTQQADSTSGKSYLVNSAGDYVLGWMADAAGNIQGGTLTPVYTLPTTIMPGSPTTTATLSANLPASVSPTPSPQTNSVSVTDTSGATASMQLTWTRVNGNTWTAAATGLTGSTDTVSGSVTVMEDSNQNITSVTPALTQAFTISNGLGATVPAYTSNTTVNASGATVSSITSSMPIYAEQTVQLQAYDSNGTSHALDLGFESIGGDKWYVHGVTSETGATITSAPVAVSFNGAGGLISPNTMTLAATWANGQTSTVAVDLSGLTQYSGTSIDVASTNQDGFASGTLTSAGFNSQGVLVGQFDNAQTRSLFQLPVATFVSENSLASTSGTLFTRTTGAGAITISAIGTSPAHGEMVANSVESSTVDISQQFTTMILAQKAYSSNSQVFTVENEMTTVASNLQT